MALTDEAILRVREDAIINAFNDTHCFTVKPKWSVYSDSIHVELVKDSGSPFDELITILKTLKFLRTVTIWVSGGKQIKTTRHKKRLFWYGSDHISKLTAKKLLEQATSYN